MNAMATFDENNHCTSPGWATYHERKILRQKICGALGHKVPERVPQKDYSPQAFDRCGRCSVWLKFFNVGTHRFGSLNRDVWAATIGRVAADG